MCDTIGIKIPENASIAKCVAVVRKIDPSLAISDITSRINANEYVLSYDYTSNEGVKNIIHCYEELIKLDIHPTLYELDNADCTLDLLKNLDAMYDEISDEIDAEMDAEDEDE